MVASILQYNRSQTFCRYQKEMSVYMKACGLGGKANDTTHLFGFTMSSSWINKGIVYLSKDNRRRLHEDMKIYYIFGGHDNLNIGFRVYEMRMDRSSHFDSGTTATVYIIKDLNFVRPCRTKYLAQRAIGCRNPIRARDVFKAEVAATPRLLEQNVYIIKTFLTMHPSFCAFNAQNIDNPLFQRPPQVMQLPTGPEHATCQYMLDTVHMEEASQEGNRQVLEEWLRQLELDGERGRKDRDSDRLLIWLGDQLTTIRIRFVKRDRSQDMNFMQRFEQFVEHFGWFHAQLAEEFSLHKQYFGTTSGLGFKHAFTNMGRKGLDKATTQGNFHYGFREGLKHTAEARFRDIWCKVSGVETIEELNKFTPEKLDELARKIAKEYASTGALEDLRRKRVWQRDEKFEFSVQFCRDLLNYLNLDDAIKSGDVGRMELLLPRLLFRYHGGGSHNYSHESLEVLQGLWREWDPVLRYVSCSYSALAILSYL